MVWNAVHPSPDASVARVDAEWVERISRLVLGHMQARRSSWQTWHLRAEAQRQVRDQIGYEVRTASTRLDSARTEVEAANLGVTLAREGVTQAQDRFRAGVANNIEVITAQDELSRANDNQISALYRYNQARADVARATGQMESLYAN